MQCCSVCCLRQETWFWVVVLFFFLVNFFINYLDDADYQGTELNTRRAVLRVSTETPHHPGHDVAEVGTSPGLFLKNCSDQFWFLESGSKINLLSELLRETDQWLSKGAFISWLIGNLAKISFIEVSWSVWPLYLNVPRISFILQARWSGNPWGVSIKFVQHVGIWTQSAKIKCDKR